MGSNVKGEERIEERKRNDEMGMGGIYVDGGGRHGGR